MPLKSLMRRSRIVPLCFLVVCATGAHSEGLSYDTEPGHWRLAVSPYTHHFRYSAEHRTVWAVGMERQLDTGWLGGASYFKNSFGQPSGYVYIGRRWEGVLNQPELYAQFTGGVLYGYTGKFKTKVPLNYGGFAPGAVPSLGWQATRQLSAQINLLGDAGVMLQVSYDWH